MPLIPAVRELDRADPCRYEGAERPVRERRSNTFVIGDAKMMSHCGNHCFYDAQPSRNERHQSRHGRDGNREERNIESDVRVGRPEHQPQTTDVAQQRARRQQCERGAIAP